MDNKMTKTKTTTYKYFVKMLTRNLIKIEKVS